MEQETEGPDRAFVLGHGLLVPGRTTWVPPGSTVHFYADVDHRLFMGLMPGILAAGDLPPRQTYRGGDPLPNYTLAPFAEEEIRDLGASASHRLRAEVHFVGNEPLTVTGGTLPLCTDATCGATGHGAQCYGLFARMRARELHLVTCRGSSDRSPLTTVLGGVIDGDEYGTQVMMTADHIMTKARNDAFYEFEQFMALPHAVRVSLQAHKVLEVWVLLMTRPHDAGSEWARALVRSLDRGDVHGLLLALPGTIREALAMDRFQAQPPSRLRPTLLTCWASTAHRLAFVEWVSTSADARRGLALVRVYRTVDGLLDRMRLGGQGNTDESYLAKDVLVDLDGLLDEGGYRLAGLDVQFHDATADMIEYASTGPGGKPADVWQTWPYEVCELFEHYVVRLLRRLEAAAVAGLKPLYATYVRENSP